MIRITIFLLFILTFVSTNGQEGFDPIPKLFVFVGEKIEFDTLGNGISGMDYAFHAKYKIHEKVYGKYTGDTIEFKIYDHRGIPAFSKFNTVMLYVSTGLYGDWYHEKYQFQEIYQTKDGKWAGPYDKESYDFNSYYYKDHSIAPVEIDFKDSVYYDKVENPSDFQAPYYFFKDGKYIPIMGNYSYDLFLLKRNGILKARGYF